MSHHLLRWSLFLPNSKRWKAGAESSSIGPVLDLSEKSLPLQESASHVQTKSHKHVNIDFQVKELSSKVNLNEKFDASVNPQHAGITPLALACALNKTEMTKVRV